MNIVKYLRAHASQFALYIMSGCLAATVSFGGYLLLVHFDVWYIHASIISDTCAFITAFCMHKYVVFRKRESFVKHLGKYAGVEFINTLLATALLFLLVEYVGAPKELAKLISMGSVVMWNFFVYKYFVYI